MGEKEWKRAGESIPIKSGRKERGSKNQAKAKSKDKKAKMHSKNQKYPGIDVI